MSSSVGADFPSNFDGRRKQPKPIDKKGDDGFTPREKKLLQFRDTLGRRRRQLAQTVKQAMPGASLEGSQSGRRKEQNGLAVGGGSMATAINQQYTIQTGKDSIDTGIDLRANDSMYNEVFQTSRGQIEQMRASFGNDPSQSVSYGGHQVLKNRMITSQMFNSFSTPGGSATWNPLFSSMKKTSKILLEQNQISQTLSSQGSRSPKRHLPSLAQHFKQRKSVNNQLSPIQQPEREKFVDQTLLLAQPKPIQSNYMHQMLFNKKLRRLRRNFQRDSPRQVRKISTISIDGYVMLRPTDVIVADQGNQVSSMMNNQQPSGMRPTSNQTPDTMFSRDSPEKSNPHLAPMFNASSRFSNQQPPLAKRYSHRFDQNMPTNHPFSPLGLLQIPNFSHFHKAANQERQPVIDTAPLSIPIPADHSHTQLQKDGKLSKSNNLIKNDSSYPQFDNQETFQVNIKMGKYGAQSKDEESNIAGAGGDYPSPSNLTNRVQSKNVYYANFIGNDRIAEIIRDAERSQQMVSAESGRGIVGKKTLDDTRDLIQKARKHKIDKTLLIGNRLDVTTQNRKRAAQSFGGTFKKSQGQNGQPQFGLSFIQDVPDADINPRNILPALQSQSSSSPKRLHMMRPPPLKKSIFSFIESTLQDPSQTHRQALNQSLLTSQERIHNSSKSPAKIVPQINLENDLTIKQKAIQHREKKGLKRKKPAKHGDIELKATSQGIDEGNEADVKQLHGHRISTASGILNMESLQSENKRIENMQPRLLLSKAENGSSSGQGQLNLRKRKDVLSSQVDHSSQGDIQMSQNNPIRFLSPSQLSSNQSGEGFDGIEVYKSENEDEIEDGESKQFAGGSIQTDNEKRVKRQNRRLSQALMIQQPMVRISSSKKAMPTFIS
ncbi:hypothetical protein FGO68_gene13642 [Halteria grandinella]|uniref:Uncharacterized protein n=1 Tax=Halteria grandinella TaxID=5974 RepID=A0A8J8P0P9_HALGN|nr:hypothetical protein FGO68_gene13642 [Halteria grandinella]